MKQRLTMTLADEVVDAIDAAGKEVWTELDGNRSALVSKIVIEFARGRSGGGKTAKVEKRIERLDERMAALESKLDMFMERFNNDTDHA